MSAPVAFRVAIPARYAASRLPGKPLRELAGRPLIEHVYRRARESGAREAVVATDDTRVREIAESFGARVVMTAADHRSGTERLAEAVERLGWGEEEIVVNLQGDEPLMPPALLRQVAVDLAAHPEAEIATLCARIHAAEELFAPEVVKVVVDERGYALYFSRAPIPWDRDAFGAGGGTPYLRGEHLRHVGLYAYRVGYLARHARLGHSPLEHTESLEQLRALWHGIPVHVALAEETPGPGVDTEADLERAAALLGGA